MEKIKTFVNSQSQLLLNNFTKYSKLLQVKSPKMGVRTTSLIFHFRDEHELNCDPISHIFILSTRIVNCQPIYFPSLPPSGILYAIVRAGSVLSGREELKFLFSIIRTKRFTRKGCGLMERDGTIGKGSLALALALDIVNNIL